MFYGCKSLVIIDMSDIDLSNVQEVDYMFYDLNSLEYISLRGIKFSNENKDLIIKNLTNKDNLIVCQYSSDQILTNENYEYSCCTNYDIDNHTCDNSNYIIVYYGSDNNYEFGGGFENYYDSDNTNDYVVFREGISF